MAWICSSSESLYGCSTSWGAVRTFWQARINAGSSDPGARSDNR